MKKSISADIRALLADSPGMTFPEIVAALPNARHQIRQMSTRGLLTTQGPRGHLRYFLPTEEELRLRRESLPPRRGLAREPRAGSTARPRKPKPPQYEYLELLRVPTEDLDRYGASGWRVVSAIYQERVIQRPGPDLPAGWTVLLEFVK